MCVSTVKQMEKIVALEGGDMKPIFGICMGNQLMGLAAGCTAEKLPFGNRGQNQVDVSVVVFGRAGMVLIIPVLLCGRRFVDWKQACMLLAPGLS